MNYLIAVAVVVYISGFVIMFAITTQLPNTFGLALLRSACWPASIVMREIVPRGAPLPMD